MNKELYKIKGTEPFLKKYELFLNSSEIDKFSKFKERLKINPYIGDPLRVKFVREFKTETGKRLYFLIYDDLKIVLFVAFSNKKKQRATIKRIFEKLDEFKKYIYKIYKS